MANALARESSPYLLQHAENPVDWLPWGPEALARAAAEGKPLLVSIGYSACHWCHVMARESFSDERVAAVMNRHFVCVKVDREERPDVDALCMEAVQTMTGQGGWPLNVFLTPEQAPFHGGTYSPPEPREGMASWTQVLLAVARAWERDAEAIREQGAQMAGRLAGGARLEPSAVAPSTATLESAQALLRTQFDAVNGGWGGAPKFPAPSVIAFLLRRGETAMAGYTLTSMASGGIYDQVGGGFARYAVDEAWVVPHFEKMLSDNALLARAYLHGFQATGRREHRRVCEETLDWILQDLRGPEGAFMSALDADSGGVEGAFSTWSLAELDAALGPDAEAAIRWFGATAEGNAGAGRNVLEDRGPRPEAAARIRLRLREVREQRPCPGRDEKRLTAWNALAISAFAEAGAVLGRADYLDAARTAAAFVLTHLRGDDGRLLRSFAAGHAHLPAYLEDHALLLEALLHLYEATFEPHWFLEARGLADVLLARFEDPERGGFFSTADDAEQVLVRRKELDDQPIPAGGSSAALGLLRLGALSGERHYAEAAERQLRLVHEIAGRHPAAFGHLLQALDEAVRPGLEVAIVGPEAHRAALLAVVRARLRPGIVLAGGAGADARIGLLAGREAPVEGAVAHVCEAFACRRPVATPQELGELLGDPAG